MEGTHPLIYKVDATDGKTVNKTCFLKIFRKESTTPYNLETTAYEYLRNAGIEYYIHQVYGRGYRTVASWGFEEIEGDGDEDGRYSGILTEWLEGLERGSQENITFEQAPLLVVGLSKIHDEEVLHADICQDNMVVIPGTSRGVSLHFSVVKVEHDY